MSMPSEYKYPNPADGFAARINDYERRIATLERLVTASIEWVPFAPTWRNGTNAILSVSDCRYTRINRTVIAHYAMKLQACAAGQIQISFPFPIRSAVGSFGLLWGDVIGVASYVRVTGQHYGGLCYYASSTEFYIGDNGAPLTSWSNSYPSAAVGDELYATITFEAAT